MAPTPLIIPIDGRTPEVDAQAWVAPTAVLAGAVTLGGAGGCLVRRRRARGKSTRSPSAPHQSAGRRGGARRPGFPATIGSGVSVAHAAVLHGCTIEDDCLIGMGAIVLNGAVVGSGSMVAAGAVVLEGARIPPGWLVAGVPGKVRRELTDDERAAILRNAETYCGLARTHAAAG